MKITTYRGANRNALIAELYEGMDETLTFPTSAAGLMKLIQRANRDDCSVEEAVKLAAAEPLVAARMVALANSAAYNRGGRNVTNVTDAVSLLGLSMLKSVASAMAMSQLADRASKANETAVSALWAHSVEVAALVSVIARRFTNVAGETAFFAGILHEIAGFYALSKVTDVLDLGEGGVVGALKRDVAEQESASASVLAAGTTRLLALLHVPDDVAEAIEGQWRGYLMVPPETFADALLVANLLASTQSPFESRSPAEQAGGLDLDDVLTRSEVGQVVRSAYDQVRLVQQAFARRGAT